MSQANEGELERLASRIALLVGDDGEAEAAGRAVGAMARRLGLSGGHLKAIFMAGTTKLGVAGKQAAELTARADRLAREARGLERSLEQLEVALHQATQERDQLREELNRVRAAADGARAGRQLAISLAGLLLVAMLGGGAFALYAGIGSPSEAPHPASIVRQAAPAAEPAVRGAVVRPPGADVYADADQNSAVRARLPAGSRLAVRQLLWRNFAQWAETGLDGRTGYVQVTNLDLDR